MFDRLLHRRRRRKARAGLAGKRIRSVLFLCDGNAFRSPYAAAAFRRALGKSELSSSITIGSAGFFSPGRAAPEPGVSVARARGIDLSSHVSTLVTPAAVNSADLVAVMSANQARSVSRNRKPGTTIVVLGDLDPLPIESRTISDPNGRDVRTVARVFSRIDRCVEQLAKLIAQTPARDRTGRQNQ